jgi:hypothetical protein
MRGVDGRVRGSVCRGCRAIEPWWLSYPKRPYSLPVVEISKGLFRSYRRPHLVDARQEGHRIYAALDKKLTVHFLRSTTVDEHRTKDEASRMPVGDSQTHMRTP